MILELKLNEIANHFQINERVTCQPKQFGSEPFDLRDALLPPQKMGSNSISRLGKERALRFASSAGSSFKMPSFPHPLSFDLLDGNVVRVFPYYGICYLPHLDQIILCCTANDPWVVHIPAEIGDVICMTAVHKQPKDRLDRSKVHWDSRVLTVQVDRPLHHPDFALPQCD